MRYLVVYSSLTGRTRKVAEAMAGALGADLMAVRCDRYGPGPISFVRACIDSLSGRLPPIEAEDAPLESYDLVVIAAPVWAGRASTPMRAYLRQTRGRMRRAAFVLTCGGHCPAGAFMQMVQLTGVEPEARLVLRDEDFKGGEALPKSAALLVDNLMAMETVPA